MRSLRFKTPKHEAMECETLVRNIHSKNQDGVCHVTKNKHGDECMQNLKQKENLGNTKRPRCPKHLFLEAKAFMEATKKGNAFFIYVIPSIDVEPCPHKILS
jgi:hypothetical protein